MPQNGYSPKNYEIEPLRRLLFVLNHENNNRRRNDLLYYCISEQGDRTYSSLSHARESHNTIKMLTLSVLERQNDCIIKFAFVRLTKE